MKNLLWAIFGLILILIATVLIRTVSLGSRQIQSAPVPPLPINLHDANQRLASALSIPTISFEDTSDIDYSHFLKFHEFLVESYPLVHSSLERKIINRYSLLYTWPGDDPDLKPILLLAHFDVVPILSETLAPWEQLPFAGIIDNDFIWGRGALDDKASVLGILEALEFLLQEGFQPKRTLLIAIGHDEEIGGNHGAKNIAALLSSLQIQPEFILDEGGVIVTGAMPGISGPVGLIGIAEKGYMTLELRVEGAGGHSSMPPKQSTIGILSTALHKLEANPLPGKIEGPVKQMFHTLAPEMGFSKHMIFANLWLFSGLVKSLLSSAPGTNAMLRTTTAVTMFNAGIKDNVLPAVATAAVNFRLKPGDSSSEIIEHVSWIINDSRVQLVSGFFQEASPVSDINNTAYNNLATTIRQVFPNALVTPWLTVAGTDTRHFTDLCRNIYRFLPIAIHNEDINRIHGINERISVKSYYGCITFYAQLIKNATR